MRSVSFGVHTSTSANQASNNAHKMFAYIARGGNARPGPYRYVTQNRDNIDHKAQYKITTTLVSCKPIKPCIATITNYIQILDLYTLFSPILGQV